jgi:hypothetical protein
VDRLITSLGHAIYFPYLAPVVILGAIWLAWQGLIRRRGTRTIEGTVWMVIACAAAIWLIGRPGDFTGFGKTVSDGITQTLNVAFAKLPAPQQASCVPVGRGDPQAPAVANFGYSAGNGIVDTNANELWTVLVCKPWLDGEFGTMAYSAPGKGHPTVVNDYGRQLLWAQAIAANEKPTQALITAKQNTYAGIASSIKSSHPAVYPLFQGKQWTTRLEIGFASLFAALLAGVLVLLIAITLIVLKLGFLLLLVAGPFFLIVGTHPGFGRVIAVRWGELLVGVLLKQAAVALVLCVLLYAYSLIMGTSDAVLPWALKILMIALVTVAVFIYRKPFTHLFSAVGYGVIGSRERAEAQLARAGSRGGRVTSDAASVLIPGFAAYRVARWARRNPGQAASVAAGMAAAGPAGGLAGAAAAGPPDSAPPAAGGAAAAGPAAGGAASGEPGEPVPPAGTGRGRFRPGVAASNGRTPPPLDLPPREEVAPPPPAGWARGRPGQGRSRDPAPAAAGGEPVAPRGGAAPPLPGNGAPVRGNGAPVRANGAGPAGNGVPVRGHGAEPVRGHGAAPRPGAPSLWAAAPRLPGASGNGRRGSGHAPAAPPRPAPPRPAPPPAQAVPPPGGPGVLPGYGRGVLPGQGTGPGGAAGGTLPSGPFWLRSLRRRK